MGSIHLERDVQTSSALKPRPKYQKIPKIGSQGRLREGNKPGSSQAPHEKEEKKGGEGRGKMKRSIKKGQCVLSGWATLWGERVRRAKNKKGGCIRKRLCCREGLKKER